MMVGGFVGFNLVLPFVPVLERRNPDKALIKFNSGGNVAIKPFCRNVSWAIMQSVVDYIFMASTPLVEFKLN